MCLLDNVNAVTQSCETGPRPPSAPQPQHLPELSAWVIWRHGQQLSGYCDSALLMMLRCANCKKFQKVNDHCCCSPCLIRKRHLKSPSGPSRKGLSACENQACQLWLMWLQQEHQATSAAQYFPHSGAGWQQFWAVRPLTGTLVRLKG